jgi:hypothetical protein
MALLIDKEHKGGEGPHWTVVPPKNNKKNIDKERFKQILHDVSFFISISYKFAYSEL